MFEKDELARVRGDTPGLPDRLHLDNCGASLMPQPVLNVIVQHLELEARLGGYEAQEVRDEAAERLYSCLAVLFGGQGEHYAFTASAVEAWVRAFYSVPMEKGDNIVTAYNEYCANFVAYLQQARRRKIEIRVARSLPEGGLDLDHFESLIDDKTRLVTLSYVPSSSGEINPVAEVGRIAKEKGVPYLLDACQSVGQMPVNVDEIGCDMMTGTGRKFLRGPRGTGFLYVRPEMIEKLDPVFLTNQAALWTGVDEYELRNDARVFEGWERSIALQLGLTAALDYYIGVGPDEAFARIQSLSGRLRQGIAALPGAQITCPPRAAAGIITFNLSSWAPDDVKAYFKEKNVGVQVARRHHTLLDMDSRGLESTVRVAPHYYNTEGEIDRFLGYLAEM